MNIMEPKKNPKLEIGRNSSLYFAIGLNIMLFASWYALNYKTYDDTLVSIEVLEVEEEIVEDIPITTIDLPPPPPPPPAATEVITVVENIVEVEETVIESTETSQEEKIEERVIAVEDVYVEEVEEDVEVAFAVIEKPPIYPGCENVPKKDLKKCFSKMVLKHIQNNFRYPEAAKELNIQGKVYVHFVVNKNGLVSNIKTRGPDDLLEKEAERIISSLPKMTPGNQRGRNVGVPYAIPIHFQIRN